MDVFAKILSVVMIKSFYFNVNIILKSAFSLKDWFSLKLILASKQRVSCKDNLQKMQTIQGFNFGLLKKFILRFEYWFSVHCGISSCF